MGSNRTPLERWRGSWVTREVKEGEEWRKVCRGTNLTLLSPLQIFSPLVEHLLQPQGRALTVPQTQRTLLHQATDRELCFIEAPLRRHWNFQDISLCVFTCITSRGRRARARGRRSGACVEQTPAVAPYPWRELYLREGEIVHWYSYDLNNPVQIISYIRRTQSMIVSKHHQ